MNRSFWRSKRVFLTGHTGFKGGWLTLWLNELGAEVHGYALASPTEPNFFRVAGVERRLATSTIGDIRDEAGLSSAIAKARPDIVFHLAAQPLVRRSYAEPVETFSINVMGTIGVFEAIRRNPGVRAVVNVTSDKCYENHEGDQPYRENEALGGYDPYSSSKACAEIATAAWRRSFLESAGVALGSVRAGNVIGGGDWADDRLLPDFFRALDAGQSLIVRSPNAVRPWQHVLEPLSGYLQLAEKLFTAGAAYAEAWNFGPDDADARTVQWIADALCTRVAGTQWTTNTSQQLHEANTLKLDSSKARAMLDWRPRWNLEMALAATIDWHLAWKGGSDMATFSLKQIQAYEAAA